MKVVRKQGESVDSLIKRYKRVRDRSGIAEAIRKNEYYISPSERRKKKHDNAIHRRKRRL